MCTNVALKNLKNIFEFFSAIMTNSIELVVTSHYMKYTFFIIKKKTQSVAPQDAFTLFKGKKYIQINCATRCHSCAQHVNQNKPSPRVLNHLSGV